MKLASAAVLAAAMGACSGDTTDPPTTGAIQVTVATTGSDIDPNGYTALVDGGSGQAVGANGSVSFSNLDPGSHEVTLDGVAANCTVTGANPRSATVLAGETAQVAFAVTCAQIGGSLVVTTTTSGVALDPDGYTALVDGANPQAIANDGSATFLNVPPGTRSVSLAGLAANCSVNGANPRDVSVTADQIATTTFNVVCAPIVADLEVVTLTTGEDLDPNGYTFTIDGLNPMAIGIIDSVTVSAEAGQRSVRLESVANNCTVASTNPRIVDVPTSGSARVEFVVSCTSVTGSLVVTTATTGVDLDPNGYTATVNSNIFVPIGINATVAINDVPAGNATVELTGLASNCTVSGDNPRTVTVVSNAAVQTDFSITCEPVTGTVEVITSTTGVDIDPNGYTVRVAGVPDAAVGVNASVSISGVVWGDRSVELLNLEDNCAVNGENPRTVTVPQLGTVQTTFDVVCEALTGNLMVTASTTGGDLDPDGYMVSVDGGTAVALPTNGSVTFDDVAAGDHSVLLTGIAPNCTVTGNNPATVTVPSVGTGSHTFNVTCSAIFGSVEVTTSTTGQDIDPDGYSVTVEGETPVAIGVNQTITVNDVSAGDRTVELTGVAPNCTVSGNNPRTVTVTEGGTVSTTFDVTCAVALDNQIVFDTNRDGNTEIYVMTPTGTGVTRLTTNAARDAEPFVSPSGTKIVFVSDRDGNNEIYVMNADGTSQTRLTNDAASDIEPAWSPDGTKIVFSSHRDGNSEVYVMNADGSGQTRLTTQAGRDGLAQWSPDGTKIVFSSERDGDLDIWVMDANGSNPVQLTNNAGLDFAPAWSPDGTKIAFTSEQGGGSAGREIYVMNADGSSQTALTSNAFADVAPQWSPDGTQIAFASSRDGNSEVYVMNANGTGQTNITNNAATDFEVSWSP